jgi:maltooligosyltrehalose trehalohydrolase
MSVGARYREKDKCDFCVWAPLAREMQVRLLDPPGKVCSMRRSEGGYWTCRVEGITPGSLYVFIIDGKEERPDPASFFQPEGVHGPSSVVDHNSFKWTDTSWRCMRPAEMIIYEVHCGTFSERGDLYGAADNLEYLRYLGVNAVELMPLSQFPGNRNWGYDGVYPYSVHSDYGGPGALKHFVDRAHSTGLAVILDVVYNHLGPEGNYLRRFGPYFTDKYKTPWGEAVNYDGPHSDAVRKYFIENALYWLDLYHIDGLRLDAIHGIYDTGAVKFLEELSRDTKAYARSSGKTVFLIAESDRNDPEVIRPFSAGGMELDAQWCDDFHHSIHAMLTGEDDGYYKDFGDISHLVKAFREGYVFSGQYSEFRKRRHGAYAGDMPPSKFVVFDQNHDQVGNRKKGSRLSTLVSFEELKLAAGCVLLSPYIPLLFMGEEYAEKAPFNYFISHGDRDLVEAVRKGRREEFRSFGWNGQIPDPEDISTFTASKIDISGKDSDNGGSMFALYRELISIRKRMYNIEELRRKDITVIDEADNKLFSVSFPGKKGLLCSIFNFSKRDLTYRKAVAPGTMKRILDSSDVKWGGPGSSAEGEINALSFMLLSEVK